MPQSIISQFEREYASPIETSRQVSDIATRNSIPTNVRWEGMLVYVLSETTTYELRGGLDNTYWSVYGGTDDAATHYRGLYNATTGLPAISDGTGEIGDEYLITGAASPTNVDFGSGNISLQDGDIILYDGAVFFKKVNNNQTSNVPTLQEVLDEGNTFTQTTGAGISGTVSSTGTGISVANSGSGAGFSFINSTTGRGISGTNSSTGYGIYVLNSGGASGIYSENTALGFGISVFNSAGGQGIQVSNSSTGRGIYVTNNTGRGLEVINGGSGYGIFGSNSSSGRGIYMNNGAGGMGIQVINVSTGDGIDLQNSSTGIGFDLLNSSTGIGLQLINDNTGDGLRMQNDNSGRGLFLSNNNIGDGIVVNNRDGIGLILNSITGGTGLLFSGQQEGVDKITIDRDGNVNTDGSITTASTIHVNNSTISETGNMVISHNTGAGLILFRPVSSGSGTGQMILDTSGNLTAIQFSLAALNTAPASAGAAGTTGEIRITSTHIYVCTATNTWKRVAISTW